MGLFFLLFYVSGVDIENLVFLVRKLRFFCCVLFFKVEELSGDWRVFVGGG